MTSTSLENLAARGRTVAASVDPSAVAGVEVGEIDEGEDAAKDGSVVGSGERAPRVPDGATGDVAVLAKSVTTVLRTSTTTAWPGG